MSLSAAQTIAISLKGHLWSAHSILDWPTLCPQLLQHSLPPSQLPSQPPTTILPLPSPYQLPSLKAPLFSLPYPSPPIPSALHPSSQQWPSAVLPKTQHTTSFISQLNALKPVLSACPPTATTLLLLPQKIITTYHWSVMTWICKLDRTVIVCPV